MKKFTIRPRKWGLYPIMKFFYFSYMIVRIFWFPILILSLIIWRLNTK